VNLSGAHRENGGGGLFGSLRQIPNQAGEIAIVRIESGQQLCVLQRFGKIPRIAIVADERDKRVAVVGVPNEILLQNGHCLVAA